MDVDMDEDIDEDMDVDMDTYGQWHTCAEKHQIGKKSARNQEN
jgi:hypothetical protein